MGEGRWPGRGPATVGGSDDSLYVAALPAGTGQSRAAAEQAAVGRQVTGARPHPQVAVHILGADVVLAIAGEVTDDDALHVAGLPAGTRQRRGTAEQTAVR